MLTFACGHSQNHGREICDRCANADEIRRVHAARLAADMASRPTEAARFAALLDSHADEIRDLLAGHR